MDLKFEASWKETLQDEMEKPYFRSLKEFVSSEYETHQCYPPENQLFSAFDHTSFNKVKVVILGQDPYHGPQQANGLCFSVNTDVPLPPSLKNIYAEIKNDLKIEPPQDGDLMFWAEQGVLMLNATLSVRAHEAGSHQKKGWEAFTDAVIKLLSKNREGLVFMLWGGYAKKKGAQINKAKHLVLESGHPSPLSANRGYWFGNKHFSKANDYLIVQEKKIINWGYHQ